MTIPIEKLDRWRQQCIDAGGNGATDIITILCDELEVAQEKVSLLDVTLMKINVIRESIVGLQTVNFSEHIYPLVAALNTAGYKGLGYPESKKNLGTLLQQRDIAEAISVDLRTKIAHLEDEVLVRRAGFLDHYGKDGSIQWQPPKDSQMHAGMRFGLGAAAKLARSMDV